MSVIGIFFGSDTGNTEKISYNIQDQLGGSKIAKVFNIAQSDKKDIERYDRLIFGIPTWYYGEAQCDWDDFFVILETINFSNKLISIFGCGDQEDYAEYFCDAMGILHKIVKSQGATIVGHWSSYNYHFESSKGLIDDNHFIGLAIDEDRQPELTDERIKKWTQQITNELHLN